VAGEPVALTKPPPRACRTQVLLLAGAHQPACRTSRTRPRPARCGGAATKAARNQAHVVTANKWQPFTLIAQGGDAYDDPARSVRGASPCVGLDYSRGSRRRTRKIRDPIAAPARKDGTHLYHSKSMRPDAEPSRETAAGGVTWNSSRTNTAASMTPAPRILPRFGPKARAATRPIKAGTTSTTTVR
jgi:hypothetical protein